MSEIQATLSKYPIKTRLSLSGTLVVARDIAHAKLKERLDNGQGLPQYVKDHIIYYAGTSPPPATLRHDTHTHTHTDTTHAWCARRSREDAGGLCVGLVRSHHCWSHGAWPLSCVLAANKAPPHADGQICDNRTRTWTCS
jgi:hypothetical protein